MDFSLTPEQRQVQARTGAVAQDEVAPLTRQPPGLIARDSVLQAELTRTTANPGAKGLALTVPACSVRSDSELAAALTRVLAEPGRSLIEAVLA